MAVTEVGYKDERLADGTVCRRFEDGRTEWRVRLPDQRVSWRDSSGRRGVDELLGAGVVKREHGDGRVEYAREHGYGRTVWPRDVVTVNRTSFGGRLGTGLAAIGAGAAMGALLAPPDALTEAEEEELRRQRAATTESGVDVSSDADDWGDDGGDMGDGDFG